MLQSSTSSGIAYSTTGPNDWIANGSNLGEQEQQRPQRIDFTKEGIGLLNQFIDWYHYINETRLTRADIFADDIINWKTIPNPPKGDTGSLGASTFYGGYKDSGGFVQLSVIREYKGLRGDDFVVRHAEISLTGNDRKGNEVHEFRLVVQDGGAVITWQRFRKEDICCGKKWRVFSNKKINKKLIK